jgi:hypothetical protein
MIGVAICRVIKSPPLDLKTVEMRKMWSLRKARGRQEATNVGAALSFTDQPPGLTIPNITCSSTPLELLKLLFTIFCY